MHVFRLIIIVSLSMTSLRGSSLVCAIGGFGSSDKVGNNFCMSLHNTLDFEDLPLKNPSKYAQEEIDTTKDYQNKIRFARSYFKSHVEVHGKTVSIDLKKRDAWIAQQIKNLSVRHIDTAYTIMTMRELIHEHFYQASYRLIDKGMIKFEDGSYLKMISTSSHTRSDIGDVTVAINEKGDVYINQGHICGRIIHFNTHQRDKVKTAADFITHFTCDTDDEPWIEMYTEEKNKIN